MKVTNHVKLSLSLSLPAAYLTDPFTGIVGCLIGGVLIDGDHVMDYYLNYRIPFNREGFFSGKMVKSLLFDSPLIVGRRLRSIKRDIDKPVRSFLLLHNIELWAFILIFAGKNPFWLSVAIGGIGHLIGDYLTWKRPWYAFSFIYRLFIDFALDEIQKYKDRLKSIGVDVAICKDCGVHGVHEVHYEPMNEDYRNGPIENFMILCPECHDKRHIGDGGALNYVKGFINKV
jgi:hypothetical protein